MKIPGATVVSQGWGEVGRAFGMAALRDGARLIAIEELWNVGGKRVPGLLVHPKGEAATVAESKAWVDRVQAMRAQGADLRTFAGGALMKGFAPNRGATSLRVDIVGINALGGTLNKATVPDLVRSGTTSGRAKVVVEGANLAETSEGARLLDAARGKVVTIPGDLANLGGVHVSNLEAVQNTSGQVVSNAAARASLQETIATAWSEAEVLSGKLGVSMRAAIQLLATDRMMKRSLGRADAVRVPLERRVLGPRAGKSAAVQRLLRRPGLQPRSRAAFPRKRTPASARPRKSSPRARGARQR